VDPCNRSSRNQNWSRSLHLAKCGKRALRNRVFELRFPSRLLEEEGADQALIELFSAVKDSPSPPAFLLSVGKILLPTLRDSYQAYLEASDSIADGPTHRFLSLALSEKVEQIRLFEGRSPGIPSCAKAHSPGPKRLGTGFQIWGAEWACGRQPRCPPPGLCRDRKLTPFPRTPPETRGFGHAAFTGLT